MTRPRRKSIVIASSAFFLMAACVVLFMFFFRKAQDAPVRLPGIGPDFLKAAYEPWADSVLATLSTKEKIAQLFLLETDATADNKEPLVKQFSELSPGGILYRATNFHTHVLLSNELMQRSKVRPLIAANAEFGIFESSDSTYAPPSDATLANFANDSLVEGMARYVAGQFRTLGIHMNIGPSLATINETTDPSYDPGFLQLMSDLGRRGALYTRAFSDSGIIACLSSFPNYSGGKGPQKPFTPLQQYARNADTIRLYPFLHIIDSGLQSILVQHIPHFRYPALRDEFFLRKPVIMDSLRQATGFTGLVLGDLRDTSLSKIFKPGDAQLLSLMSGSDMLVIRDSFPERVELLYARFGKKGFTQAVLDLHVKKILMAKAWARIPQQKQLDMGGMAGRFDKKQGYLIARRLYESSLVLVQDRKRLIPLGKLEKRNVIALSSGGHRHHVFTQNLNHYFPVASQVLLQGKTQEFYDKKLKELDAFNTCIVSIDFSDYDRDDRLFHAFLEKLEAKKDVIIVLFGSHAQAPLFSGFSTVVLTYGYSQVAEMVAGQFVFGGMECSGRLPVSCTDQFCYSDGLYRKKTRLRYSIPEEVGMDSRKLLKIDSIVGFAMRMKATPGCQVFVAKDGNVIFNRSYGYHTYAQDLPVSVSDIYDLASVTKVAATTIGLMKLYDEGKLKLDTVLSAYIPGLERSELKQVKIRDVLTHRAGFPGVPPVYKYVRAIQKFVKTGGKSGDAVGISVSPDSLGNTIEIPATDTIYKYAFSPKKDKQHELAVGENIYLRNDIPDSVWLAVTRTKLVAPGTYKYSDMSMYVMMWLLQQRTGMPLDVFMETNFYRPLGLTRMGFNPLSEFERDQIIPTEDAEIYRRQLVHGYVHDPIAAMLGGVSGHAGLFSNAADLGTLMQMVLNGGSYGGRTYFSAETVNLFTSVQPGSHRGIGWDHQYGSLHPMIADSASIYTYGHTGFTGTCVWVDPKEHLVYVFLSNRVHPDPDNALLQKLAIRQRVHQAIYDALRH